MFSSSNMKPPTPRFASMLHLRTATSQKMQPRLAYKAHVNN